MGRNTPELLDGRYEPGSLLTTGMFIPWNGTHARNRIRQEHLCSAQQLIKYDADPRDVKKGDSRATSHPQSPIKAAEGEKQRIRQNCYEVKIKLRSSRAGPGTAPRKTNADIEYMVAIVGFIIDALELIPKPFVAVTNIYESLFMNE